MISIKKSLLFSVALCLLSVVAVAGNHRLIATGSSTVAPVMSEIARGYELLHPDIRIDVQTGGSSRGVADALSGQADIGMVSRNLNPHEQALNVYTIAKDGVAVIVHRNNPLTEIEPDQLRKIYGGEMKQWRGLGWDQGGSVVVVNKAAGRSTLELFLHYLNMEPDAIKADIIIGDNQQGLKTVAGNGSAIGYVSIGAALRAIQDGEPIKLIRLQGVDPTLESVMSGVYPISRPLNLVMKKPAEGVISSILEYIKTEEGKRVITSLNFVPAK